MFSGKYQIKPLYRHRNKYHHFDDTDYTDEYQLEIYLYALGLLKKHGLAKVFDLGCGSAYKSLTYLNDYAITGAEIGDTLNWLREKYPDREWLQADTLEFAQIHTDVIICSDVIEHVEDPDALLNNIKKADFKFLIISTPARNMMYKPWQTGFWGPPDNPAHQREWSAKEFRRYISSFFSLTDQRIFNMSLKGHWTQMAVCTKSP